MIYLGFLLSFFIFTPSVTFADPYYGPLIRGIYKEYCTGGVILTVARGITRDFSALTTEYDMSMMLSKHKIPSRILTIESLQKRLESSAGSFRPLVVAGFVQMEDVYHFQYITRDIIMSNFVWLMIFAERSDGDACEYCQNPHGNFFNLKFHSKVFVSCCDSKIIEQWWSPNFNRTTRKKIGQSMGEDGGTHWFNHEPFYKRRNSLERRELRVTAAKQSAFIWQENGKYGGYFGEILNELSATMNFTISEFIPADGFGIVNPETSEWTGVIGKIQRNEADIGVSPISMTHARLNAVDFTFPLISGKSRLYIKKLDGGRVQWQAYFKAFALDVWMVIIGLILIMPLFLTVIRYRRGNHLVPQLIEHYSNVWGIWCQQGLSSETSLRMIYLSIFMSTVVSASVYSASLVSSLTVFSSYSPFKSMEEFVADGTYGFIVLKYSAQYAMYKNSKDDFRKRMMSLMLPEDALPSSLAEGFRRVCQERIAFETNEAIGTSMASSTACEVMAIDTKTIETFGMITPRQSEYLEFINYRIRQFELNGVFRRLKKKYFTKLRECEVNYPKVHVEGVEPILLTLAGGFLITLIIFIIELLFHWSQRRLHKMRKQRMIYTKRVYFVKR